MPSPPTPFGTAGGVLGGGGAPGAGERAPRLCRNGLPGDDAFATNRVRNGGGADRRERAAGADGEAIDLTGPAALHIEPAAVRRERRVHGAGTGGGVADECRRV